MSSHQKRAARLLGATALVEALLVLGMRPREPAYQGRRFSSWLADLDNGRPREVHERAVEAMRAMGTNALPHLAGLLRRRDSAFKQRLVSLSERVCVLKLRLVAAPYYQKRALNGFQALGPRAAPAMSELAGLLSDEGTASNAAFALAQIGKAAVPTLPRALVHGDHRVRSAAAGGLGLIGSDAESALVDLARALNDVNSKVASSAAEALAQIRRRPDIGVSAMTDALKQQDAAFQSLLLRSLSQFGRDASAGVPQILALSTNQDAALAAAAIQALDRIDPEAAARARHVHHARPLDSALETKARP